MVNILYDDRRGILGTARRQHCLDASFVHDMVRPSHGAFGEANRTGAVLRCVHKNTIRRDINNYK